eukprot:UN04486
MGVTSCDSLCEILIPMFKQANNKKIVILRIGSCGGIGVPGGTQVMSTAVLNEFGEEKFNVAVCGKLISFDAKMNQEYVKKFIEANKKT